MENTILEMEASLINEGKNIETTVMFDGDYAHVLNAMALGVIKAIQLMGIEADGEIKESELYEVFCDMLSDMAASLIIK